MKALIVDDEKSIREITSIILNEAGFETEEAESFKEAANKITKESFDLLILDLRLPDGHGMEILRRLRETGEKSEAIIITAFGSSETAKEALRLGAFDYVTKPFDISELRLILRNVKKKIELEKKLEEYELTYKDFIGESAKIKSIKEFIKKIAPFDTNVLILGESGTGKEVAARTIHKMSHRRKNPFVAINCASLPAELLESELFGYKKGAFTGATSNKEGLIEKANGGTLFLDEIGDMPIALQAKILRFIEDRKIRPIGDTEEKEVDIRIVAATNKSLEKLIEDGTFREDLYYRLATITIEIPPLRERKEDIPLLVNYFVKNLSKKYGKKIEKLEPDFMEYLYSLPLKGNIRELRNIVEKAIILSDGKPLSLGIKKEKQSDMIKPLTKEGINLKKILEETEKFYLKEALKKTEGKKTEAAELLGLTFRELRYRLSKYKLDK